MSIAVLTSLPVGTLSIRTQNINRLTLLSPSTFALSVCSLDQRNALRTSICEKVVAIHKETVMNVDSIRAYCLSFPGATEKLQWGDALCFKIREKMFAVLGLDRARFTFKCSPEAFTELIERQDIAPAPYVGRHNWVMLDRLDALPGDELRDFIRQSYEMVEAKAPRSKTRPLARKKKSGKPKSRAAKTRGKKR
jgi:predicted DNA-binding protein (MmcQ/YjbR family)